LIAHHDLCFGCGVGNLFGLHLEAEYAGGELRGRFFVKQDLQGPPGTMHGGLAATALDEAMALLMVVESPGAPTARLETDLRAPIPVGVFLEARARVVEREGRKLTCTGELLDGDGAVLAQGRGIFIAVT
jgi:acyl-coenzyme A thioesterase PaaI-like protein